MKLSVNDWQDFSLKKDIEKLNRLVQHTSYVGSTVAFDVVVAFGAVLLGRLFDCTDSKIAFIIYLIASFLLITSLLLLLLKKIIPLIRSMFNPLHSPSIREFIDSFDNEIWCYVMMSDSFLDSLTDNKTAENNRKYFYYSQTCFWVNKAIMGLFDMIFSLKDIFDKDSEKAARDKKVSIARLENLLDIIVNIKKTAYKKKKELGIADENLTGNVYYHERYDNFLSKAYDALGIDIERFRLEPNS